MFSLRSRGVQALGEPDVLRRLAQLDDAQAREIAIRLQKLKPHIASCVDTGRRASAAYGVE